MNQNEHQEPDLVNGENELTAGIRIGALFSDERKKKGLSYAQIYLKTRIRPPILEALENEDWGSLPSPVFVTGFIRSYARALGLEEEKAVRLYHEAVPVENDSPMPIVKPAKTGKHLYLFLVFFLLAMASAYYVWYVWKEYPAQERISTNTEPIGSASDKVTKSENIIEIPKEAELAPPNQQIETSPPPEPVPERSLMKTPDDRLFEEEEITSSKKQMVSLESRNGSEFKTHEMILKADIRERTWIRISVDDQDPKEYIFQPERHQEWRAKKAFELLIGNAGGIDLEFNGKKIENLGDRGQVVRVRLPKNYERRLQD